MATESASTYLRNRVGPAAASRIPCPGPATYWQAGCHSVAGSRRRSAEELSCRKHCRGVPPPVHSLSAHFLESGQSNKFACRQSSGAPLVDDGHRLGHSPNNSSHINFTTITAHCFLTMFRISANTTVRTATLPSTRLAIQSHFCRLMSSTSAPQATKLAESSDKKLIKHDM